MSFSQRQQLTEPFKIATMHQRGYLLEIAPSFQSWFICFFDDRWRQSTLSYYTIDRNARDYYWSLDLLRRGHCPANQWAALGPFQGLRKLYHYYRGTSVGMQYIDDEQIYKHLAAALARGQMEVHKVYDPHEAYRAFAAAAAGASTSVQEEPESTTKPETLRVTSTPQLLPLDLHCLLCDGQPAANLPYQVVLADGSQLSGTLDATGKAHHDDLKPGAVSVTFGEQSDPAVEKATRNELAAALSKMVADEQAQATALAATWGELSGGEKVLVSTGALFTGLWNGATSAAEFVANIQNVGSLQANLMRFILDSWSDKNSKTFGWINAFKNNWSDSTHQAYVRALGFDPSQISRDDLARAYETASLIYDDAETRALLVQFGIDFAAAQHHTEWTEMGGASLFEVVLTAILAVSTGGAGAAARMGTNVSHLKKLGGLFEKMADVLRKKKIHRTADGSTGGKVEAQLDKTEGAEGFEIKVDEPVAETAAPYYDIASDAAPPAIADTPAGTQVIDELGDLGDGAEGFVASSVTGKGAEVAPTTSSRVRYMGATPDKYSRTGREVVERMRSEGMIQGEGPLLRGNPNDLHLVNADGSAIRIDSSVDMAHQVDAVSWWNEVGRFYGPKATEVRQFMLNPDNYVLQPSSMNRSAGAQLGQTYQPPVAPEFSTLKR